MSDDKETQWIDGMKAKGHNPRMDENCLDIFAFESGYHNGPACTSCGDSWCWHCDEVEDILDCRSPVLELQANKPALTQD